MTANEHTGTKAGVDIVLKQGTEQGLGQGTGQGTGAGAGLEWVRRGGDAWHMDRAKPCGEVRVKRGPT